HLNNAGSSLRFGYGVNADIHFTENYAIGTGFKIVTNGGRLQYFEDDVRLDENDKEVQYIIQKERDYKLKYVEFPVTLKLRTNEIGYITYWGQFGLGLGANISAKADDIDYFALEFDDTSDPAQWVVPTRPDFKEEQIDIKDDIQLFRASLYIAGGIEYNLSGSTSVIVGVTFDNGFTNPLKGQGIEEKDDDVPLISSEGPVTFDLKAISNSLGLTVGILF
ncbi:MAG: outer membrane beta-barrel protein, partial [Flavobacteriales bacterium]|nr:outer membrane beta-barrel protein [Flavobacteriales bacterium]